MPMLDLTALLAMCLKARSNVKEVAVHTDTLRMLRVYADAGTRGLIHGMPTPPSLTGVPIVLDAKLAFGVMEVRYRNDPDHTEKWTVLK